MSLVCAPHFPRGTVNVTPAFHRRYCPKEAPCEYIVRRMMVVRPFVKVRAMMRRWYSAAHGDRWFPQVPLALAIAIGGLLLLRLDFGPDWRSYIDAMLDGHFAVRP